MPKINLRLTDEEHEQLRAWAFDSKRSMQKEAVFRIFDGHRPDTPETVAEKLAPVAAIREAADRHFKPDFKK